jgi:peptide/nickel transport system permease protein
MISGFYGTGLDRAIMGAMDVLLAFPGILLALAIIAALGPGLAQAMVAVGVHEIPSFARLVRGSVLSIRTQEYVDAARALGASDGRIMVRHVAPNVVAPVIVLTSLAIGTTILATAALSFLGLGAQPPLPDWRSMINQGRAFLRTAWWVGMFPGLAIMLTVLGFNLIGGRSARRARPTAQPGLTSEKVEGPPRIKSRGARTANVHRSTSPRSA